MNQEEIKLRESIENFVDDPLGFVQFVFAWGEGELKDSLGPDVWQEEILTLIGSKCLTVTEALQIAVRSGKGIGKLQPCSTIIPTPDGYRQFGDLQPNDYVWGLNGLRTKVTGIYPNGFKQMYRISFDDGSSTLAGEEHLWQVKGRKQRRKDLNKTYDKWEILTTKQLIEKGVRYGGKLNARQWEIPIHEAVQYESPSPIDGYLMGCYLGNGHRATSVLTMPDLESINELRVRGFIIITAKEKGNCYRCRIIGESLKPYTGKYSYEKRIPIEFLTSRTSDRLDLLRGLMDTDGTVSKESGSAIYTTTSLGLANDIIELVRSLGGKAQLHPTIKKPFYKKNGIKRICRDAYNVTVTTKFNPFLLRRKANLYKIPTQDRYLKRWIDNIEKENVEDSMCIAVDSEDGLYLTNDFIVTHNTALIAWIILWFISTRPNPHIVVTANTQSQLDTTTWRELAKWHLLAIHKHWFTWTATKLTYKECPETWYASAIPWSENKAQAFAGKHAEHVLVIFDEASEIADTIWEKADGAMTTENCMFIAFGNPTLNTGRFYECFNKFRHRWITREVDSRTARLTNKVQIGNWIKDYGEDSDYVRVNVKGREPRSGSMQLISSELIQAALGKQIHISQYMHAPVIIGVDVARFGKDKTAFYVRQGLATLYRQSYREIDTMQCASLVAKLIDDYDADAVFVDVVGIGSGVVDRLIQLGYKSVLFEVNSGKKAIEERKYFNLRAEMWLKTKFWLEAGGCIPADNELRDDLGMVTYGFDGGSRYQITKKEDLPWSPDDAEALIHTFAYPVNKKKRNKSEEEIPKEFDPFAYI